MKTRRQKTGRGQAGEIQEQAAKRWGIDRSVVAKMILRLRNSI